MTFSWWCEHALHRQTHRHTEFSTRARTDGCRCSLLYPHPLAIRLEVRPLDDAAVVAGTVEQRVLLGCQVGDPIAVSGFRSIAVADGAGGTAGCVFEEDGAALMIGSPRHCSVGGGFGEEEDVARFHFGLGNDVLQVLDRPKIVRWVELALVAARYDGEATVTGTAVGELPGDRDPSASDPSVLSFVPVGVAERLPTTVKCEAFRASVGSDKERTVVETEAWAAQLVEARDDDRMDQQPAEEIPIRFPPAEHAGQLEPSSVTREDGRRTAQPGFSLADVSCVTVDGLVARSDFSIGQCTTHDQVTTEVTSRHRSLRMGSAFRFLEKHGPAFSERLIVTPVCCLAGVHSDLREGQKENTTDEIALNASPNSESRNVRDGIQSFAKFDG